MLLREIIYKSGIEEIRGLTDREIISITSSSGEVKPGWIFAAIRGSNQDGHRFIGNAIQAGASAIICESFPEEVSSHVTYIKVKNSAAALAQCAANLFNNPSEKLKLTGVTGTNGKTTTATLLFELFSNLGYSCGLISTVKNQIRNQVTEATHTTPDPVALNRLLAQMVAEGCTHCFMEVSSHAVAQYRVHALHFAGGIFTNITHDHLDYHKSFENYLKAKKGFFDMLPAKAFALINSDDRNSKVMVQNTRARVHTYGLRSMSNFKCRIIENHFSGLLLNIDGREVACRLIGSFNAYNLLGIYAAAVLLGIEKETALKQISNLGSVEGRFDYIVSSNHVTGIVDYAHTPDALQNVLQTIRDLLTGNEQVITVVGCGGNRDRTKRPLMSKIACELSDKVILTSDNPRMENPLEIIKEMQNGVEPQHYKKVLVISDRREAIRTACSIARQHDIVLVAGKGHEKYQEIEGVKYPFDDKKILKETFDSSINTE